MGFGFGRFSRQTSRRVPRGEDVARGVPSPGRRSAPHASRAVQRSPNGCSSAASARAPAVPSSPPAPAKQRPVLGLEVQFPNQAGKGLMVSLVKPDGPAKEAGIQVGDLLVKLDGAPIPPPAWQGCP